MFTIVSCSIFCTRLCGCKAMAAWRADSPYVFQQAVGDLLPRPWLLMLMVPPNLVANRNNALMFEVDCTTCKQQLDKPVCTNTHPSPSKNPAKYSTLTPFVISNTRWRSRSSNRTGSLYCLPASSTCVCRWPLLLIQMCFFLVVQPMTCNFLWYSSWHIRDSELHSPVLLGSNNTDRWPACRTGVEHRGRKQRARYNMAAQTASRRMGLLPQATRFSLRTNQCCENRSWSHWNLTLWLRVHEFNLFYYKGILRSDTIISFMSWIYRSWFG